MADSAQDQPQDLSVKRPKVGGNGRKVKPIPPPLDLNARTLPESSLNLRKRTLIEQDDDLHVAKSPRSAFESGLFPFPTAATTTSHTAPSSPAAVAPSRNMVASSAASLMGNSAALTLTPSSGSSSINPAFTHFPVPPTISLLGHHPHHPLVSTSIMPKSPFFLAAAAAAAAASPSGFPTPPTDLPTSPYPWPSPSPSSAFFPVTPFSPVLPSSPLSSLLSHPSSTSSSREDLPPTVITEAESRLRISSATSSSTPTPSPSWLCFLPGSFVKFLIPQLETPWQSAEELEWKDRLAAKVDSRDAYRFAPNGLVVVQMDVAAVNSDRHSTATLGGASSAFTPVHNSKKGSSCSSSSDEEAPSSTTVNTNSKKLNNDSRLRMRLSPYASEGSADILADCSVDHPFYVRDKGWCSASPNLTLAKHGIHCQELKFGDVCLPPPPQQQQQQQPDSNSTEIRTPDLCDRFRRFDFAAVTSNRQEEKVPKSASKKTSASEPSKAKKQDGGNKDKKDEDAKGNKPKRPMNGFMLFAKKYRLELIQQHPGKDNRAISVLLGEAWKALPGEERQEYSRRAKVMADEQKKIHPDCWKRKRTAATTAGNNRQQQQQQQQQLTFPPPAIPEHIMSVTHPPTGS